MNRPFCLAAALCVTSLCMPKPHEPRAGATGAEFDWIDRIVNEEALAHYVPGLGVSIVAHGKVVAERVYGLADVEHALPVTPATGFNIASVSKPFTAIAVLRMASRGEIDLDAPARSYLDWLPDAVSTLTVRQLLSHTSGIVRDVRTGNEDDPTEGEYRDRIIAAEPSAGPGARWEYSNVGYAVLGWAAEGASGLSLDRLLAREVFTVAEMTDARFRRPVTEPDRAQPYRCDGGTVLREDYVSGGFGSGGTILSTRDFTAFAQALQMGQLLSEPMQDLAWSPGLLADGRSVSGALQEDADSYGCGWFLTSYAGHRLVTHGGGIQGYSANLYHFPDDGITIAVVANVKARDDGTTPVDPIARRLADHMMLEIPAAAAEAPAGAQADEREAVRRAVLDYVEGIYEADPARIERSVDPGLVKRGFWRADDRDVYAPESMTYAELLEVARTYNAEGVLLHDAPRQVDILDVLDKIATAKVVAQWGVDYLQLAKLEGQWRIVHVLWQSPPPNPL